MWPIQELTFLFLLIIVGNWGPPVKAFHNMGSSVPFQLLLKKKAIFCVWKGTTLDGSKIPGCSQIKCWTFALFFYKGLWLLPLGLFCLFIRMAQRWEEPFKRKEEYMSEGLLPRHGSSFSLLTDRKSTPGPGKGQRIMSRRSSFPVNR